MITYYFLVFYDSKKSEQRSCLHFLFEITRFSMLIFCFFEKIKIKKIWFDFNRFDLINGFLSLFRLFSDGYGSFFFKCFYFWNRNGLNGSNSSLFYIFLARPQTYQNRSIRFKNRKNRAKIYVLTLLIVTHFEINKKYFSVAFESNFFY